MEILYHYRDESSRIIRGRMDVTDQASALAEFQAAFPGIDPLVIKYKDNTLKRLVEIYKQ